MGCKWRNPSRPDSLAGQGRGPGHCSAAGGGRAHSGTGSRSAERARQKALEINQQLGEEKVQGMDNHELVASCEMLFLTVPFVHAEKVIGEYQQDFSEVQILVDVTVPVVLTKALGCSNWGEIRSRVSAKSSACGTHGGGGL